MFKKIANYFKHICACQRDKNDLDFGPAVPNINSNRKNSINSNVKKHSENKFDDHPEVSNH